VVVDTADEVINEHYGWRWTEKTHKELYMPFAAISALSLGFFAMAV